MVTNGLLLGASAVPFLNTGDIIFTIVAFAILMFIVKKLAWGPLMGIMQERENYIAKEIKDAEDSREEAKKYLENQRALLKEARTEAQNLIETAKKQSELQRQEMTEMAQEETKRMKETAALEIEQQKEQAVAAIREQVASLSVLIASKVIEKELSAADQEKLINEYIHEAGEER